jgi:hypothetical protein
LSFYLNAKASAGGKFTLKVNYADLPPSKEQIQLSATNGYEPRTMMLVLQSAAITKIKAQVKHTSSQGKVLIDGVSLRWIE